MTWLEVILIALALSIIFPIKRKPKQLPIERRDVEPPAGD